MAVIVNPNNEFVNMMTTLQSQIEQDDQTPEILLKIKETFGNYKDFLEKERKIQCEKIITLTKKNHELQHALARQSQEMDELVKGTASVATETLKELMEAQENQKSVAQELELAKLNLTNTELQMEALEVRLKAVSSQFSQLQIQNQGPFASAGRKMDRAFIEMDTNFKIFCSKVFTQLFSTRFELALMNNEPHLRFQALSGLLSFKGKQSIKNLFLQHQQVKSPDEPILEINYRILKENSKVSFLVINVDDPIATGFITDDTTSQPNSLQVIKGSGLSYCKLCVKGIDRIHILMKFAQNFDKDNDLVKKIWRTSPEEPLSDKGELDRYLQSTLDHHSIYVLELTASSTLVSKPGEPVLTFIDIEFKNTVEIYAFMIEKR